MNWQLKVRESILNKAVNLKTNINPNWGVNSNICFIIAYRPILHVGVKIYNLFSFFLSFLLISKN